MNVLVVNCGSSSLKFQLINYDNRDVLAKGLCERIGIDGRLVYEPKNGEKEVTEAAMPTHVEECADLGPLHNPANLMGINACMKLMPGVPNVAVFDTAFHQTMPPKAYMYGIPKEYYEKYAIRKYGFHGTSHPREPQSSLAKTTTI